MIFEAKLKILPCESTKVYRIIKMFGCIFEDFRLLVFIEDIFY